MGKEAIATKPNGTGPFKLVEWVKNERLVLEANPSYWRGAPKVKTIVVRPILEDAARIAALQTGEVDLIAPIPRADRRAQAERQARDQDDRRAAHLPRRDDRRAQAALRQRQGAPGAELRGGRQRDHQERSTSATARAWRRSWTRARWGYDPSVTPYPYDPTKAKALLAEAGYPNGFEVEFDSFTGSIADHSKPAEAIVGYLQKVGIEVKLNVFEFAAFGPRRVANQTAPLFIYSIGNAYLEPSWVIRWMTQGGLGMHYKNGKLDEMLTRIEATDDPKKRADLQRGPEADQGRGAVHLPVPGRRRCSG